MTQPPRSKCMLMPALPCMVGEARRYVRWVLDTWGLESIADSVELLVSELVTNAVNATGVTDERPDYSRLVGKVMPVYLCVSTLAETVVIEVWDASSTPPLRRAASEEDEDGRGLALVQALSKEWGCEVLGTGGKVVWCKYLIGEQE
jgi:anti-sigma regulatory factor (Ser/Thr protein kinase)